MSLSEVYQAELPIIHHKIEKSSINQRATDGYINATEMCQIANKRINNYIRLQTTKDYINELSAETRISVSALLQQVRGGNPQLQGTWVHPQVAIHLAQWLSPKFAVMVNKWVFEWMSGQGGGRLPNHIRRYLLNRHKIPNTHFSMLDQMTLRLLAPLEAHGYLLPENMMPDIALGQMFSKWLRNSGHNPNSFPTYNHEFLDHRPTVPARLYPNELITEFNIQLDQWLQDGRARRYFNKRDPSSIGPLSRVLALPSPSV